MSERRMRVRVTPWLDHYRRRCWQWKCQWCMTGSKIRIPGDEFLPMAYDEAWTHGWKCWGQVEARVELLVTTVQNEALKSNLSASNPVPSPSHQGNPESAPVCAPDGENRPPPGFKSTEVNQ